MRQPLAIVPFAIFLFLFGPLPEELGWRGYALDRLQVRRSALIASLILGAIWALWHLPLFFIAGTYQQALRAGSLLFWVAILGLIPESILITWIYNNMRRSTLSAVLFHFMGNFIGELFELSLQAELYQFLMTALAAVVVIAFWGSKTLTRQMIAVKESVAVKPKIPEQELVEVITENFLFGCLVAWLWLPRSSRWDDEDHLPP